MICGRRNLPGACSHTAAKQFSLNFHKKFFQTDVVYKCQALQ